MASLWDLLMGSGSLTGGAPQPQSTGLLPALAGSTAAPMGSGFLAGQATPQAPAAPPASPASQPPSSTGMGVPSFASGQFPPLQLNQKPQGFAAIRPASADMPASGAAPAMGQGVPGAAGITVPGYSGMFTRDQADDGDGRPSLKEWDAANATKGVSTPIASGLAAGKGLAAASGLPAGNAAPDASASSSPLDFMSGLLGRVKNIYGNGGPFDALINLGIGMNSGPGGLQRALEMTSQQTQQAQSGQINALNLALAQAKLQRETQSAQALVPIIKDRYKASTGNDLSDQAALSMAQNPSVASSLGSSVLKDNTEKAQLVTVAMPDGSTQQQWMTPGSATGTPVGAPATKTPDAVRELQLARQNWQANGLPDPNDPKNAGFWQDFANRRLGGGGGVSVTLPPAEKASEAAFGAAEGKHFGDILSAGDTARQTQSQLAFMNDAFNQGGGSISTGPFAKSILAAKQAILNTTGVDLGGVPESEAVNKLGFGLATNLTKEISQRPAQQEFIKALQNVPGLLLSPQGSRVMTSIINQQSQSKIDLGDLVQDPDNRKNWAQTVKNYYATHPYVSPFTGKPLNLGDLNDLRASARQAGIDPATGQAGGSSSAPAVPSWSVVGD